MKQKDNIFISIARDYTEEEKAIGNLGSVYVNFRGLGSTIFYIRKINDKIRVFTRFQTKIDENTRIKKYYFRFEPNVKTSEYIASIWEDLDKNGNTLDTRYMSIWTMSEEDYGKPGNISNIKLGVNRIVFHPLKDILHSIIGNISVETSFGVISNIKVGMKTNSKGAASFFLFDPSFYDHENKTNYSKFILDRELKNFVLRYIQACYDEGALSFAEEDIFGDSDKFFEMISRTNKGRI